MFFSPDDSGLKNNSKRSLLKVDDLQQGTLEVLCHRPVGDTNPSNVPVPWLQTMEPGKKYINNAFFSQAKKRHLPFLLDIEFNEY